MRRGWCAFFMRKFFDIYEIEGGRGLLIGKHSPRSDGSRLTRYQLQENDSATRVSLLREAHNPLEIRILAKALYLDGGRQLPENELADLRKVQLYG